MAASELMLHRGSGDSMLSQLPPGNNSGLGGDQRSERRCELVDSRHPPTLPRRRRTGQAQSHVWGQPARELRLGIARAIAIRNGSLAGGVDLR